MPSGHLYALSTKLLFLFRLKMLIDLNKVSSCAIIFMPIQQQMKIVLSDEAVAPQSVITLTISTPPCTIQWGGLHSPKT